MNSKCGPDILNNEKASKSLKREEDKRSENEEKVNEARVREESERWKLGTICNCLVFMSPAMSSDETSKLK